MNQRFQYRQSRWIHGVLIAFVVLTCLRIWTESTPVLPSAHAQLPDSAGQRLALIREAQKTNQLLREIKQILQTQTLHVRVEGADNKATAPLNKRRSKP